MRVTFGRYDYTQKRVRYMRLGLAERSPRCRRAPERDERHALPPRPRQRRGVRRGAVGIAARRLAIIDLAGGDQPICERGRLDPSSFRTERSTTIASFGKSSRSGGHRFSTHSDTEVLVHLYEEHGAQFAERLRGMFAIAVWDERRAALGPRSRSVRNQASLLPPDSRLHSRSHRS